MAFWQTFGSPSFSCRSVSYCVFIAVPEIHLNHSRKPVVFRNEGLEAVTLQGSLQHLPGEAQVYFGHTLVKVNSQLRKVAFFVMALPYRDASLAMAFERECTETFWEGMYGRLSFEARNDLNQANGWQIKQFLIQKTEARGGSTYETDALLQP